MRSPKRGPVAAPWLLFYSRYAGFMDMNGDKLNPARSSISPIGLSLRMPMGRPSRLLRPSCMT